MSSNVNDLRRKNWFGNPLARLTQDGDVPFDCFANVLRGFVTGCAAARATQ